jgi:hypothetical protein
VIPRVRRRVTARFALVDDRAAPLDVSVVHVGQGGDLHRDILGTEAYEGGVQLRVVLPYRARPMRRMAQ